MSHTHNLVIIHTPGLQDIADFRAINANLSQTHPQIRTVVVTTFLQPQQLRTLQSNEHGAVTLVVEANPTSDFWSSLASLPTLIFSPIPLALDSRIRGYRLFAAHASKLEEMEMLQGRGFPIPRTVVLTPDLLLDEATWGKLVIIKPTAGRGGQSIRIMKVNEVSSFAQRHFSEHHQLQQLMVQQWIDTGQYINSYRAMTVLDCVAYVNQSVAQEPEMVTDKTSLEGIDVASNSRPRRILESNDPDVYRLAEDIAKNLTFSPTFGIDIVREQKTGRLFVIELNSGFPTWHLSSRAAKRDEIKLGSYTLVGRYKQYNALESIANALARAVLKLAL